MRILTTLLIVMFSTVAILAQNVQGTITYNRNADWISIMSKLPYMTQEDVDRATLTWGKNERKGTNFDLVFKDNKSVYTYKVEEDTENSGWSWKKSAFVLVADYNKNSVKEVREDIGTKFLVEDEVPKYRWKILNEIKEIAGYLCMKAETKNEIKGQTIHAWFTDAIPFQGGPEGYGGLPGVILELDINEGDAIIAATKVDMETRVEKLPIPKKMKGKNVSKSEFDEKIKDYIAVSVEGRKNPFWRIRY